MKKSVLLFALLFSTYGAFAQPAFRVLSNLSFPLMFDVTVYDGATPCTGTAVTYPGGYSMPGTFFDGTSSGSVTDPLIDITSSIWGWSSGYSPTYFGSITFYSPTCTTFSMTINLCTLSSHQLPTANYPCNPFPPNPINMITDIAPNGDVNITSN